MLGIKNPSLQYSITPILHSVPPPPVPILDVQSLSKSYRQAGGETTVAIGNITCQVEAGEFVSFVGPSGCGKTTLLMSIAGLLAPSSGRVIVNGKEVNGPPANLVLLFQEYNKSLFAWRSVLGNVRFGLAARGARSTCRSERPACRAAHVSRGRS